MEVRETKPNPNDTLESLDRTDDDAHVEIIREADETIKQAVVSLIESRVRLERAMARYAERMRG